MAQKDGIIRNLEHQLEERENEIERLKISLRESAATFEGSESERVRELERRMMDLESLVKGITEELLDLKTIVMKLYHQGEERPVPKIVPHPTVIAPEVRKESGAPGKPEFSVGRKEEEEQANAEGDTVLIMQPDGTLKPEQRPSEGVIIASNAYAAQQKTQMKPGGEIIVGKREGLRKEKGSPLIFAEDEDTK